jgi:tripartite-type tricarboxylate transporter receptor subunit TctC
MAPEGTPPAALQRQNEVINQALQEAPIFARFREFRGAPCITTPAEMLEFIRAEKVDFGTIAPAGEIRVE